LNIKINKIILIRGRKWCPTLHKSMIK